VYAASATRDAGRRILSHIPCSGARGTVLSALRDCALKRSLIVLDRWSSSERSAALSNEVVLSDTGREWYAVFSGCSFPCGLW
jgi:hypothetical protein